MPFYALFDIGSGVITWCVEKFSMNDTWFIPHFILPMKESDLYLTTILIILMYKKIYSFIYTYIYIYIYIYETRRGEPVYPSLEKEKVQALFNFEKMCSRNIVVQISHQLPNQFLVSESQSKWNVSKILILITYFKYNL